MDCSLYYLLAVRSGHTIPRKVEPMATSLLRRLQAHPANERVLTELERSVLASALAVYQNECMLEAKAMRNPRQAFPASVRKEAEITWAERSRIAHDLYNAILPVEGTARIAVRT